MTPVRKNQSSTGSARRPAPRLLEVTFCRECGEAIPKNAMACFRCGAKGPVADRPLQVVFCERCGKDYPVKAITCFHCGHQNPRHPLVSGHGAA